MYRSHIGRRHATQRRSLVDAGKVVAVDVQLDVDDVVRHLISSSIVFHMHIHIYECACINEIYRERERAK